MKKIIKKISVAVCVATFSLTLIASSVSAAPTPRPMQGAEVATTETVVENTDNREVVETSDDTRSMAEERAGGDSNKKGFTHWNAFLWFVLSVIVNFVISCWVGNRFYRLARKSTQTSNEIRALRKDIEEKFASTLTNIEDPAVEVMNRNENYSRRDEGLSMPEHKTRVEMNDEEREMMRKWDKHRVAQRVIAKEEADGEEYEEEELYEARPAKRAYQPTRRSSGIEFEEDEYDDEGDESEYEERQPVSDRKPIKKNTLSKATNKAKDFLSNVFPFED